MPMIINGREAPVPTDARVSLLDFLREHLELYGTKKGCNQGACGACTVLVDGERVLSCLALAVQYEGREVTTIEGLTRTGRCTRYSRRSSIRMGSSAATAPRARSARRSAWCRSFAAASPATSPTTS